MYMEIYYEELAHTINEKRHDLLSASWKPWKVRGVIQFEFEGLITRVAAGVNSSLRAGKDEIRCPGLISEAGEELANSSSPTFGSIQVLNRLDDAQRLYEFTNSNASLIQKHFHRHWQKQLIWVPAGQSC